MNHQKAKGFSLLEVLVACSILVVGVLAAAQLFPVGLKSQAEAKKKTTAVFLAQSKMDEYLGTEYSSINPDADEAKARVSSNPANPFYNYYRSVDLRYVDSNFVDSASDVGLIKITTTVFWSSSGTEKNISITYVKSQ